VFSGKRIHDEADAIYLHEFVARTLTFDRRHSVPLTPVNADPFSATRPAIFSWAVAVTSRWIDIGKKMNRIVFR
jgi:hypothetical protein